MSYAAVTLTGIDPRGVIEGGRLWLRGEGLPAPPDRDAQISVGGAAARVVFAAPDRIVLSITGDGGFLMNGMEVSTAVHYGQQVIWVVLNDAGYGMAYHGARIRNISDVGTRYPRVDCAKVAEGLGAQAFHVREPGQINREFMNKVIASGRPTVLDVEIDPDEVAPFGSRLDTLADYFTV